MKPFKSLFLALALLAPVLHAAKTAEYPQYRAFLQARGEASWIRAGADHPLANSAFRPIPPSESFPSDPAKSRLGTSLFHEPLLSADGTVVCSSCHHGRAGGADRRPLSVGIGGALGGRNSPTIFNAAFNFRQFWDGRAFDLAEQALGPITNPLEMGHDLDIVLKRLSKDPYYARQFALVYPDGITAANLGDALAQHTKNMTLTDSAFNLHLSDHTNALGEQAMRGWRRFEALGCSSCHNGINLGGNSYQLASTSGFDRGIADEGLFARSGREQDRQVLRVPSLHNVAITPPYFHDGSVGTLEEAVRQMGILYAGRDLQEQDVADVVAFLETLTAQSGRGMHGMGGMQGMRGMQGMGGMQGTGGMHGGHGGSGRGMHAGRHQHGGPGQAHGPHRHTESPHAGSEHGSH
ncbi:c-type cytochrome [Proteobacteria bacterium 005FR1]|nr:c-type cytochrome [Proteobacteria bacterium 005FR1]